MFNHESLLDNYNLHCVSEGANTRYIDMYGCYIIKNYIHCNSEQPQHLNYTMLTIDNRLIDNSQRSQFVNCSMHTVIAHYVLYYTCRHTIIAGEIQLYM